MCHHARIAQARLHWRQMIGLDVNNWAFGVIIVLMILFDAPQIFPIEFRIALVQQHDQRVLWDALREFGMFENITIEFSKQLVILDLE